MKAKLIHAGTKHEMEQELNAFFDCVNVIQAHVEKLTDGYLATVLYQEVEA